MAAVSETIVREYFELQGFFVRQQRKYIPHSKSVDEEIDFFVWNPEPRRREGPLPFILGTEDVRSIARAVVVVKGWHTERFSPALFSKAPEILRFVEPRVLQRAARAFGPDGSPSKILIVPGLPQDPAARRQSLELLRDRGVDAVLPFHALLADLIAHVEVSRNYQKSDLLQVLRILKNYEFFREPQLELFRAGRRRRGAPGPGNRAASPPD